jgi:flagellum-specific ATP synthase
VSVSNLPRARSAKRSAPPRGALSKSPTTSPVLARTPMDVTVPAWALGVREASAPVLEGHLTEVVGLVLEARGCRASIGDLYEITPDDRGGAGAPVQAEVVALRDDRTLLMTLEDAPSGLAVGSRVRRIGHGARVPVGDALLGRVLDGLGRPIDGKPSPRTSTTRPLHAMPPSPLARRPIDTPLDVGVRAIDGMLTLGRGQRMGIFAGGGVGKSTLLGMMVKHAAIDVAVVALVGERGREVEEFVRHTLGESGLSRSVVVAATSSDTPLLRARAALSATAIAEHFRDQGKQVLLVMDSLTRYAMALREIGLATGEPPTTKGYTPSVFAALPRLLERAGTSDGPGSITGLYTVLVEGDDLSDPISDAARAILDGHIVLRRALAERGHFPAIDVPASISRVMGAITQKSRRELAQKARSLLALHREAEDLVAIGAYRQGASPKLDEALARMPKLEAFLTQGQDEPSRMDVDAALASVWGKS